MKTKSTLSDEEDETEYEIDQILAVRVQREEYEYLVSWKGYSARLSSSWLGEAELAPNAAEILATHSSSAGTATGKPTGSSSGQRRGRPSRSFCSQLPQYYAPRLVSEMVETL